MPKRTLIIVTCDLGNEFFPFWRGSPDRISEECKFSKPLRCRIGKDYVAIINGEDFEADKNYGTNLINIIRCSELDDILYETNLLGIISHGFANRDISSLNGDYNVVFNKNYSSSFRGDFCDQNNGLLVPNSDPEILRSQVLDAFRDALILQDQRNRLIDAFNDLWTYFHGDPIIKSLLSLNDMALSKKNDGADLSSGWMKKQKKNAEIQKAIEMLENENKSITDFEDLFSWIDHKLDMLNK